VLSIDWRRLSSMIAAVVGEQPTFGRGSRKARAGASVPNPFDEEDATFLVLLNSDEQYCLWPGRIAAPDGWRSVLGPVGRRECLEHIEENWLQMRSAVVL